MLSSLLATLVVYASFAVSQSTPTIVCIPGQCLQGFSNTTIGAKLSASGSDVSVHLLPGQYTSDTDPQLLHDLLTSSSSSLAPSPGFDNATTSLPLDLRLNPGISIFSDALYSGRSAFSALPSQPLINASTALPGNSLALSSSVWVAVTSGSERVVLWDSVPDVSQLPIENGLALTDIQSTACSPACSGNGICSAAGTCTCPPGFTGSSCETCAEGFFGPQCQECPEDCDECDEGLTGSGRCLKPVIANAPSTCDCLNGQCGANGQCTCNTGWETASNGTACAQCADGFFLTSTGDCRQCNSGCASCSGSDAVCTSCRPGFTRNTNDQSRCDPVRSSASDGTLCPSGTFSDAGNCRACDRSCDSCSGSTSNDCTACPRGAFLFNGVCLTADGNGVCQGTELVADNEKKICDTCGAKCTSCRIPGFSETSTIRNIECTGCLPGSFLSEGKCVDACPSGTFLSEDNTTCAPCDSSCASCASSSTFCLSCPAGRLASNGQCIASCPAGTFASGSSCLPCHTDCESCSGSSFTQCSTCPSSRPVLANGRCLPTCSKAQFFDSTSKSCQSCDSSCGSCSGAGPGRCLSCSSPNEILRRGECVPAECSNGTSVVPGLGACLSQLVQVPPPPSGTETSFPLPTVTGIDDPTVVQEGGAKPLEWWQILLMALGCAFIFLMVLMCWRRRAKKKRAQRTQAWARMRGVGGIGGWKERLVRFGERLFGHSHGSGADGRTPTGRKWVIGHPEPGVWVGGGPKGGETKEAYELGKLRDAEEARSRTAKNDDDDMGDIIDSYQYSRRSKIQPSSSSYKFSDSKPKNTSHHHYHHHHHIRDSVSSSSTLDIGDRKEAPALFLHPSSQYPAEKGPKRLSGASSSIYSQITGLPRRAPEPRVPLKQQDRLQSRFSTSTYNTVSTTSTGKSRREILPPPPPPLPTEAEAYVRAVRPRLLVDEQQSAKVGKLIDDGDAVVIGQWQPPVQVLVQHPPFPQPQVGSYWLKPTPTGGTTGSRNPFRQ